MKRVVKYEAIDPYYSDQEQTYIGSTLDELDAIEYETEKFMGKEHPMGVLAIYKISIIYEDS